MDYPLAQLSQAIVLDWKPEIGRLTLFDRMQGKRTMRVKFSLKTRLVVGAIIKYSVEAARSSHTVVWHEMQESFLQVAAANIEIYHQLIQLFSFSVEHNQPLPALFDEYVKIMRILEINSACNLLCKLFLGRIFVMCGFFCSEYSDNCLQVYQLLSAPLDGMLRSYHLLSQTNIMHALTHCVQMHPWYSKLTLLHRLPEYKL